LHCGSGAHLIVDFERRAMVVPEIKFLCGTVRYEAEVYTPCNKGQHSRTGHGTTGAGCNPHGGHGRQLDEPLLEGLLASDVSNQLSPHANVSSWHFCDIPPWARVGRFAAGSPNGAACLRTIVWRFFLLGVRTS
jgi:hypothetical protein